MTEKEGLAIAERYCASAERCRWEVRCKLEKMGLEAALADTVLDRLEKEGFIDENRYARALVHDKLRFTKWGRRKIAMALSQKHIPDDVASDALASIDEDEYMTVLRAVIQSKLRTAKGRTESERRLKVMRSVIGRGFEMGLTSRLLKLDTIPED